MLRPRDGRGTPVVDVEEAGAAADDEDDGSEDPDAFERWA